MMVITMTMTMKMTTTTMKKQTLAMVVRIFSSKQRQLLLRKEEEVLGVFQEPLVWVPLEEKMQVWELVLVPAQEAKLEAQEKQSKCSC